MTKDEARKELLEVLEEYCRDKGYNLQVFAGLSALVYTLYPLQKHMTNADKIRSMTDEQLADLIGSIIDIESCKCCAYDYDSCQYKQCPEGRLAWLKQEHKSNAI